MCRWFCAPAVDEDFFLPLSQCLKMFLLFCLKWWRVLFRCKCSLKFAIDPFALNESRQQLCIKASSIFFPVRVSLSKTCFCAIVRKWWQPLLIFLQVVNFVVFPSRCGSLNLMWLKSFATDLEIVDQAHQITCQWCVCRSSSCSDRKVCGGSVSITSYFFNQWSVSVVIFFSR